ncbi:hypothetical protein PFISCL1PPCAC_15758, partial [Pristionchus fissidentatus]
MNNDLQILPRHCLVTETKRNLLISGAGPTVQVFKIDSSGEDSPISTIHCFHRENVSVEHCQPIGDSGQRFVKLEVTRIVYSQNDILTEISWIPPCRIREFNSEIVQMYKVIDYSSTLEQLFSLFSIYRTNFWRRFYLNFHSK